MAQPKLLDQVRELLRVKHYALRTEEAYVDWIRRFILFHKTAQGSVRHPREMGTPEIRVFLVHLATEGHVAASTQNQALAALTFLYREVLHQDLDPLDLDAIRAKKPQRLPTVLTKSQVQQILAHLTGAHLLIARLLYGSGLRLMECLRLRVKDVDFEMRQITVRDGKGGQDRVTMLPEIVIPALRDHVARTRALHEQDLVRGYGCVYLPDALERKYPNACTEWGWQYIFPSDRLSKDPRTLPSPSGRGTGSEGMRRHHLHESSVQKAVRAAAQAAGIVKPVGPHTFRHCFATHLLEAGYDIRTVQELLGHKDVKTTMIYTHVLNRGGLAVRSPLDVA
jgi:integron integrase